MHLPGLETEQFIEFIIAECARQFPRNCKRCARVFVSLNAYILETLPIGEPQIYDDLIDKVAAEDRIGAISLVNCPCGNTLALKVDLQDGNTYLPFVSALKRDVARTGLSPEDVLQRLRHAIRLRLSTARGD